MYNARGRENGLYTDLLGARATRCAPEGIPENRTVGGALEAKVEPPFSLPLARHRQDPLRVDDSRVYLGQSVSNLSLMGVRFASCTGAPRERLSQKLVFLLARARPRTWPLCLLRERAATPLEFPTRKPLDRLSRSRGARYSFSSSFSSSIRVCRAALTVIDSKKQTRSERRASER